jgi:hypothetical protein
MKSMPEFYLRTLAVSLSAKGAIAFWLVIPAAILILAIAWRIALG